MGLRAEEEYPGAAIAYTHLLKRTFGSDAWSADKIRIDCGGGEELWYEKRQPTHLGLCRPFRITQRFQGREVWFAHGAWDHFRQDWMSSFEYTSNMYDVEPIRLTGPNTGEVSSTLDRVYEDVADHLVAALEARGMDEDVARFFEHG